MQPNDFTLSEKWEHVYIQTCTWMITTDTYNVPKVKATPVSINRWVGKWVMAPPHSGLWLSHRQEQTVQTHSRGEPLQLHWATASEHKGVHPAWFIHTKFWNSPLWEILPPRGHFGNTWRHFRLVPSWCMLLASSGHGLRCCSTSCDAQIRGVWDPPWPQGPAEKPRLTWATGQKADCGLLLRGQSGAGGRKVSVEGPKEHGSEENALWLDCG